MTTIQGSIVAIATPMDTGQKIDTEIDYPSLANLVEYHIEQGTSGIVVVGTTGESATLSEKEHCEVIKAVVNFAAGRIAVIAGTGANSTHEAIRLTKFAKEVGADACLLVTPYYNKPTQRGLYLHHKIIADSVDIPQILYNVPGRTACDLLPETVAELAQISNIVGLKEATGDLSRVRLLRDYCGKSFALLSGDDETACDFMLAGGDGVISVTANVAPRLMADMCARAVTGDRKGAEEVDNHLAELHRTLFLEANPIPVKWALCQLGLIKNGIRLPLTWLSDVHFASIQTALQTANLIQK